MEDQLPFNEVIAIKKIGENQFESIHPPIALGGTSAYGGTLIGLSLVAAYQTLPKDSKHKPYSLQGNYLGATSIDDVVSIRVTSIRDTRTFATRHVVLSQTVNSEDDDSKVTRDCMSVVIDFIVKGDQNMVTYSAKPFDEEIPNHKGLKTTIEALDYRIEKGELDAGIKDIWQFGYAPMLEIFEQKSLPNSVLGQNMMGMMHKKATTQDSRYVTDKTGSDWFKVRLPINSSTSTSSLPLLPGSEKTIFLSFALDSALIYLPLAFNRLSPMNASANSSSDFSVRFHLDDFDAEGWFFREMKTISSGDERTFNEAKVWVEDEKVEGGLNLVASMSQTCVLRAKEGKAEKDRKSKL